MKFSALFQAHDMNGGRHRWLSRGCPRLRVLLWEEEVEEEEEQEEEEQEEQEEEVEEEEQEQEEQEQERRS